MNIVFFPNYKGFFLHSTPENVYVSFHNDFLFVT